MLTPYIGTILYFGFDWAPKDYGKCDGKPINIKGNETLYKLLGVTYGGDGKTTFGIPDLVGRIAIGRSDAFPYAEPGGSAKITITTDNIPAHTHTVAPFNLGVSTGAGDSMDPTNACFAAQDSREFNYSSAPGTTVLAPFSIAETNAGASTPFVNMMPYIALNACIAYVGIYPDRG